MDAAEDEKLEPSLDRAYSPHGDNPPATDVADITVFAPSVILGSDVTSLDTTTNDFDSTNSVTIAHESLPTLHAVDEAAVQSNKGYPCVGTVDVGKGDNSNQSPCGTVECSDELKEEKTSEISAETREDEKESVFENVTHVHDNSGCDEVSMDKKNLKDHDYKLEHGESRAEESDYAKMDTNEGIAMLGDRDEVNEQIEKKREMGKENDIKGMKIGFGKEEDDDGMEIESGKDNDIMKKEEGGVKVMNGMLVEEDDIKKEKEYYSPKAERDQGVALKNEEMASVDAAEEDSEKKQHLSVNAHGAHEIEVGSQDNDGDDEMASVEDEYDESEDKNKEAFEEASADMDGETAGDMEEAEQRYREVDDIAPTEKRVSNGKRKRGKGGNKATFGSSSKKRTEEDVCFICFDGGDLVLCDRRGCPKAYHPSCVNHDEAFFRTKGRWNCGWHQCSVCQKNAAHYMCFTCTFSLCKGCIKESVIYCVRGNKGFCETCYKTVTVYENRDKATIEPGKVDFDDKSSWEFLFKDYWIGLRAKLSITSEEIELAKSPWKGSDSVVSKAEGSDEFNEANAEGASGSESSLENADATKQKKKKGKKRLRARRRHSEDVEWASKELLELVMHMKNGDASVCSQFDVQALLLEYITKNKLRDPRRKSQIICDSRLQNLFGKPRVGHFEMLKLLESHFLLKEEESQGEDDPEINHAEGDEALAKGSKEKKRKSRRKPDGKSARTNAEDYAAIDNHNINLIYLRRSIVENLLNDAETFQEKVVGAFVRLRIPGSSQKQDLYRLVQVVGTTKKAEPYRVGKKTTDLLLEILNLNKKEIVSIDIISNQEFTEDECKRLRQSIKCGLINPLTVGAIQEKAIALQSVRVQDSLETEITRLSHLRDRASDMGRRKELRECVEKLSVLRSHEERQRRLDELPDIHSDPKMDPNHESDDDESIIDDRKSESFLKPVGGSFNRRPIEPLSPLVSPASKISPTFRDLDRSLSSKSMHNKGSTITAPDLASENSLTPRDTHYSTWDKLKNEAKSTIPDLLPKISQENEESQRKVPPVEKVNETEKNWHYKDPSGKIQGPFSMTQLRKWSATGYFPSDLRIWKSGESLQCSYLLTEALTGILKVSPPVPLEKSQPAKNTVLPVAGSASPTPVEPPVKWTTGTNLPSPTPSVRKERVHKSRWSPTPMGEPTNLNPSSESMNVSLTSLAPSNVGTPSFDVKSLQNLVQQVANTPAVIPTGMPAGTPAWMNTPQKTEANNPVPGPVPAPLPSLPNAFNNWANPPIPSTYTGNNPTWRPPMAIPSNTTSWGPAPTTNPGWVPSKGWVPPIHAPGTGGWGQPLQGWCQPGQAPPPVNPGTGWMGPGPGPVPNQGPTGGSSNPSGWSHLPPSGTWGNDFGGRPWNRAPAPVPPPPAAVMNKGTRVCKFHESGHCKKGSACDYMHA